MAAAKGARLKTGDGETDFAHKEGEKAAAHESLTRLLHKYVYNPHDQVAFDRLLKPSKKQQAQALDVAKVAMSGLDSVMAFLQQRRKTCQNQIDADEAECDFIDGELAKKQKLVDRIKTHHAVCKMQESVSTFPIALRGFLC
ncbi:hypothetical protein T484DRAFT_1744906 [Baffinella frigidus]|nr:hypothetical protein T484DRAFT_1744906 [Cryptophyta sp. CCMP2293]